jgi:hypothetical protein
MKKMDDATVVAGQIKGANSQSPYQARKNVGHLRAHQKAKERNENFQSDN